MATLSIAQLDRITKINGGDTGNIDFYLPDRIPSPLWAKWNNLKDRACWNWALCAGEESNDMSDSSPLRIYEQNAPIDPFTDIPRANFAGNYVSEPNLAQLWNTAKQPHSTDQERIAFMQAMSRVAARANGLTPVANSPYKIHVTAPRDEWYHWQHWGLSITHNGRTRFIQTEPRQEINWGFTRLWEADRRGHIEASFCVSEIHQAHKDVILEFISMPMCVACNKVKPANTTFNSRWHECQNDHNHCDTCGSRLPRMSSMSVSRTRKCTYQNCNTGTELVS
ncbi:hypothetical protein [Aliikangiella sp. G2MR2-5]|uniref:hypothetical protein n=1 Tax=Aliikangiella sp. G2MR2-5 TaxID=2788943 RepID=UPI0018AA55B0|nr:hypothetical protein [Aliikangiella sp. G2MR2-5]